jgi:hypothetical protein
MSKNKEVSEKKTRKKLNFKPYLWQIVSGVLFLLIVVLIIITENPMNQSTNDSCSV